MSQFHSVTICYILVISRFVTRSSIGFTADPRQSLFSQNTGSKTSNHFTGLKLGPPRGDQWLDLTDIFAFRAPADPSHTALILNCNTFAQAKDFNPDAVYRLNIDNNGDALSEVAISFVFSKSENGCQTGDMFLATGSEARSPEAVGQKIISNAQVSFGPQPNIVKSGP